MTRKTLLLLGGSRQQCIAIERAKELGFRTVLCDYLPDNPGQQIADVFYLQSTTDRDGVLTVAQKENIDGILAYASDPAAPTAAFVAEKLGLPTNPLRSVEILSFKNRFREHLARVGLPCPKALSFPATLPVDEVRKALSGLSFPIVIKPTDSSGSKGVTVLFDESRIEQALCDARHFSRNGILIAETYIEKEFPYMIGGDVFVVDGKVAFDGLMRCMRDPKCPLVPMGEIFPSGLTTTQHEAVINVLNRLLASLDMRFGEFNVEVILGKGNTPYVMELGARAGGNYIPLQLSDLSGIDLVKANVVCALGQKPDVAFNGNSSYVATCVLHSTKAGIFERLDISDKARPYVYRVVLYKKYGDAVEVFTGAHQAVGLVFLRFPSEIELREITENIQDNVHVIVKQVNDFEILRGGVNSANNERYTHAAFRERAA